MVIFAFLFGEIASEQLYLDITSLYFSQEQPCCRICRCYAFEGWLIPGFAQPVIPTVAKDFGQVELVYAGINGLKRVSSMSLSRASKSGNFNGHHQ